MKAFIALVLIASQATAAPPAEHKLVLKSGTYTFRHRFAEHPNQKSISVLVKINGTQITVSNLHAKPVFPKGVLTHGELAWHEQSKAWIIATDPSDKDAAEVGGCSEGPEVVDLQQRIYWTC